MAVGLLVLLSYALRALWMVRRWALPEPNVERVEVDLESVGHRIVLHHYPSLSRRWRQPVILCHGLAANRFNFDFHEDGAGSDRQSLARTLARRGFDVWTLETRGRGWARVPRGARWTVFDEVGEDVVHAIRTTLDLSDSDSVLWVGHSWGGLLQLLLQAKRLPASEQVRAVVAIGTPVRFGGHGAAAWLPRVLRLMAGWGVPLPLRLLARMALPLTGVLNRVARVRWPQMSHYSTPVLKGIFASLLQDIPACIVAQVARWAGRSALLDDAGQPVDWSRIRVPVLMMAGTHDWLAPVETMRPVLDALPESQVELQMLGRGHGATMDYGHGGLLLSEGAPLDVFPRVARYLESRADPVEASESSVKGTNGSTHRPTF